MLDSRTRFTPFIVFAGCILSNISLADESRATSVETIRAAKDFKVELLYSVPAREQGSWVNLCTDDRGRILVSDQYGGLFRFPPPAVGASLDAKSIEKVPADIRAVN